MLQEGVHDYGTRYRRRLPRKVDNRFLLVMLASKRVKQLYKGNQPLIDPKNNRLVVTALREIAAGKVNFEISKTARQLNLVSG